MDEAAEVAKSICHGNCNAVLLVLLPVVHAGISHVTIVKHRRALEDRFVGILISKVVVNSISQAIKQQIIISKSSPALHPKGNGSH